MKKLNNFVLFPLLLGGVCLVCGGGTAALNYALHAKIAANATIKETKAIESSFPDSQEIALVFDRTSENSDLNNPPDMPSFDARITRFYQVTKADGTAGYAYYLMTDRGYSGSIGFIACIDGSSVIGLKYIDGDEDTLGINAVNTLSAYINGGHSYTSGEDFSAFVVASGASAQKTFPVLQQAISAALMDVGNRLSFNFSLATTVTEKEKSFGSVTYTVETAPGLEEDDFDSAYKTLTGEFTYTYSVKDSSYMLAKIAITASPETSEDDYGATILAGTATDEFTKTFVAPAISGAGLSQSAIVSNVAALSQDTRYITASSKALTTTYTLYSMIYESSQAFASFDKTTDEVGKSAEGTYRARYFTPKSSYGYTDLEVTVNNEKTAFTAIKYIGYGAEAWPGSDNFGMDIVEGNTASGNANRDTFVNEFVKIPSAGLPFTAIKAALNSYTGDTAIKTGASHTVEGYLQALQMIVEFIGEGN